MSTKDEALAYANDVHAACAADGFSGDGVSTSEALIDAGDREGRDISSTARSSRVGRPRGPGELTERA